MNTRRKGEPWDAGPALPATAGVLLVPVRPDDEARYARSWLGARITHCWE